MSEQKRGFSAQRGEITMGAYVLFGILAFLVFGVPTIDWLYRLRVRRETATALR
jgi:hypothetical protein